MTNPVALGCNSPLSSLATLASAWDKPYCPLQLYAPSSLPATLTSALGQKVQSSLERFVVLLATIASTHINNAVLASYNYHQSPTSYFWPDPSPH